MENGPGWKMYFLLKMGIFQPAMLVYQRVTGRGPILHYPFCTTKMSHPRNNSAVVTFFCDDWKYPWPEIKGYTVIQCIYISYHIISYRIVSYHIISYHVKSYHIVECPSAKIQRQLHHTTDRLHPIQLRTFARHGTQKRQRNLKPKPEWRPPGHETARNNGTNAAKTFFFWCFGLGTEPCEMEKLISTWNDLKFRV